MYTKCSSNTNTNTSTNTNINRYKYRFKNTNTNTNTNRYAGDDDVVIDAVCYGKVEGWQPPLLLPANTDLLPSNTLLLTQKITNTNTDANKNTHEKNANM